MADVTMSLSELDALRAELKEAIQRAAELEARQPQIRVSVRERITTYRSELFGSDARMIRPTTDWKDYPHEYLNMEDVIGPIREEERSKVQSELNDKSRKISELEGKMNIMQIDHKEAMRKLKEECDTKLRGLSETKQAITKDTIIGAQTNQIEAMRKHLRELAAQSFWQRVFNPIKVKI